ncbi:MAG: glycolate oxidase subunit GlcE [Gammaproteobacteria bacterium]|nr:glycolate oxidase subunit GlcE [Gammaproteobacteria bacterium]
MDQDNSTAIQQQVTQASHDKSVLDIRGGGSKGFYGHAVNGLPLDVTPHRGITNYAPEELVLTARAATPLAEIEHALNERGQMLPFEPPHYGDSATLGGTIACALSGPRRAAAGAARDFVLGTRLVNGCGHLMSFGGQVMKNVAGYDVSRLQCGAQGTLGVLLDVSLKVLPRPEQELTLTLAADFSDALTRVATLVGQSLPISASCLYDDHLHLRLSGARCALQAAIKKVGGEHSSQSTTFWQQIKEQQHPFFSRFAKQAGSRLWRISLPAATPHLLLDGEWLMEWNGALRWLTSDVSIEQVRRVVSNVGGHATLYRGGNNDDARFHPLSDGVAKLHYQLKRAFDPHGILNPGRIYPSL